MCGRGKGGGEEGRREENEVYTWAKSMFAVYKSGRNRMTTSIWPKRDVKDDFIYLAHPFSKPRAEASRNCISTSNPKQPKDVIKLLAVYCSSVLLASNSMLWVSSIILLSINTPPCIHSLSMLYAGSGRYLPLSTSWSHPAWHALSLSGLKLVLVSQAPPSQHPTPALPSPLPFRPSY